ncbi:hypothetical protein J27TS8_15030 [Robertmurraya siralis]|uniref:Uncharacterized protein n=1 Tax=Robertmurraya siralis TaxID=77777 RepID=A0A919WGJ2_9BACI|nr:hypothetical protein [Robertmurraya siralis]GIN61510.1 hypothetical protein J27TS8_15030 [Robertmurraya siralis]
MISNFIQSLQKQQNVRVQTNTFQPGQIIYGRIGKLFPNQTAEVQVGSQKMIAKLEVPLSSGGKYWFQIHSNDGRIHLKVLPIDDSGGHDQHPIISLLKQLGLSETNEHKELIQLLLKEKLPITKELAQAAVRLLQEHEREPARLEVLKEMMSRQLPLTKEVFNSVLATVKNEPMHQLMDVLRANLSSSAQITKDGQQLLRLLEEMVQTGREKVAERATAHLFKEWFNSSGITSSRTAFSLLQKLSIVDNREERELLILAANKLIDKAGVTSIGNNERSRIEDALRQNQTGLTAILVKSALAREMDNGMLTLKQIVSLFSSDGKFPQTMPFFQQLLDNPTNIPEKVPFQFAKEEMMMVQKIANDAHEELIKLDSGKNVADMLRSLIGKIGFDYESKYALSMFDKTGDVQKLDVLKALLLRFVNGEQSGTAKGEAEQLLYKITGVQLSSQEVSPLNHYVMQVPLSFWEKKTDLTVQWSGRKKENGEIDPAFCRVLFYLELDHLNELIVDMQIQNRIMNMTIINDTEKIKVSAEPFIDSLKENLHHLGFTLTSISFRQTVEDVPRIKKKEQQYQSSSYSGVDIRI